MNTLTHVPPGFRFHPTDEELVDYYLRRKVTNRRIDLDVIKDIDLYKIEPWDLQELCRIGTEDQNEWYFFSHKDKKYPTGTRTNRATSAGFWKATGRDKAIYSKNELIGMRKTLVFYKGRAPNGQKSDWIMHEYRLETDENGTTQEEGWAVCRVFKKRIATIRKPGERGSPVWYDYQVPFMPDNNLHYQYPNFNKKEMDLQYPITSDHHFLQLPNLESPKLMQQQMPALNMNPGRNFSQDIYRTLGDQNLESMFVSNSEQCRDQMTDWRVMDKFVASQLSQDEVSKENETFDEPGFMGKSLDKQELSCQIIDLWK
ncbi:hypothetical protein CASFOL_008428 [Castilleja foliolosa]|uniref:NAC domain-containing protein n=1 Tax=Castilleja foliolosa TaxID=1961234 RepID=A0ABD3DYY6_9LAMI